MNIVFLGNVPSSHVFIWPPFLCVRSSSFFLYSFPPEDFRVYRSNVNYAALFIFTILYYCSLLFFSRVKSQLLLPSDSISRWARAPETLALFVAAWMRNGKWCGIHLCGRQTDTNSLEPTSPTRQTHTHAGVLMGKGLCSCPVTHNPFGGCKSLFFKAFSLLQQGQKKRLEINNSKIISGHKSKIVLNTAASLLLAHNLFQVSHLSWDFLGVCCTECSNLWRSLLLCRSLILYWTMYLWG